MRNSKKNRWIGARNGLWGLGMGLLVVSTMIGCNSRDEKLEAKSLAAVPTSPVTVSAAVPQGSTNALLSASNKLTINGNGTVGLAGKLSTVAGFGAGTNTYIQADADIYANLLSGGSVTLNSQAIIYGSARSAGAFQLQDSTAKVLGGYQQNVAVTSSTFSWTVDWPTQAGTDVRRNAGNSLPAVGAPGEILLPGNYGVFDVHDRNRFTFTAGDYFFKSFNLESQAEIRIDSSDGPVRIYVSDSARTVGRILPAVNTAGAPTVSEGHVLLAYKGTGTVDLLGGFIGTIVAPNAEIRLAAPANGGQHKGSFYGKDITVDSNSQLPVVPLDVNLGDLLDSPTTPGGGDGTCPDSDHDAVCNKDDECLADAQKSKRGLCDCGIPDTDADNDLVPACVDDNDNDPTIQVTGGCSKLGVGAKCVNTRCGGVEATCTAAGTCGSACPPGPVATPGSPEMSGCFRRERSVRGAIKSYWFCPGPVNWTQAQNACSAVRGRTLALPNDILEQSWLSRVASFDAWVGIKETGGDWYYAFGSNSTARKIWSGGAAGTNVDGSFVYWKAGQPVSGGCGSLTNEGRWVPTSCGTNEGFICEMDLGGSPDGPWHGEDGLGGDGSGGDPRNDGTVLPCVESKFPVADFPIPTDTQVAEFKGKVETCAKCESEPCNGSGAKHELCEGVLSVPPANASCVDELLENPVRCDFSNEFLANPGPIANLKKCDPKADWRTVCGSGKICGRFEIFPESGDERNLFVCGPPVPRCPAAYQSDVWQSRCSVEQICNPNLAVATTTEDEVRFSPTSNLTPVENIENLFPATPSPQPPTTIPGPAISGCGTEDEGKTPCFRGEAHPWCNAQERPVESNLPSVGSGPAVNPLADRHGSSGSGKPVQFDFDPNLTLRYDVGPGLYGDFDLDLEASLSLGASVTINDLLTIKNTTVQVVDAYAGAFLKRCAGGADARIVVLGHDFLPDLLDDAAKEKLALLKNYLSIGEECEVLQGKYLAALGKAKKAYRDAQEVIRQYKKAIADNKRFPAEFCGSLIQAKVPAGFPAVDCATATPNQVVNAFITYAEYVAMQELPAVSPFPDVREPSLRGDFSFPGTRKRESETIINYPFAIGPIPMNLSVDVFYGYGLEGSAGYELSPGKALSVLTDSSSTGHVVAKAYANVTPFATAGIELFVGVGFDFGPVSAKFGISGDVTLGQISIPATSSANILIQGKKDNRLLDSELGGMVDTANPGILFPPSGFTAFAFKAGFGLDVDAVVENIMSGSLHAKLKIAFFFFSKTWQTQIVAFKGFGPITFPLVHVSADLGKSAELGTIRMPFTFPKLAKFNSPPPIPSADPDGMGGAPPTEIEDFVFDKGRVEEFFYKELCEPPVIKQCPEIFDKSGTFNFENNNRIVAYGSTGVDLHDRVKLASSLSSLGGDVAARSGLLRLRNDVVVYNGFGGNPLDVWHRVSYNLLTAQLPFPFTSSTFAPPAIILTPPQAPASYTQSGTVNIYGGQTKTIEAGSRYDRIVVFSGGTLILNGKALASDTAQEFFMNHLQVEPGGIVRINHGQGAVEVVIFQTFNWKGTLQNGSGRQNAHVFGVYGTSTVQMLSELGFQGTVVVPNAMLELNSRNYVGAYYGKFLEVHQDAKLTYWPCEGG